MIHFGKLDVCRIFSIGYKKITASVIVLLIPWTQPAWSQDASSKHVRGEETLEKIGGEAALNAVEEIRSFSPSLADWIVEFGFGEVLSRPGLSLCTRELATIASLTTLGAAPSELRGHINGALNVGCRPEEVIEILLQMTLYAGFPRALNGVAVAKEVFKSRGIAISRVPSNPNDKRR